MQHTFDSYPTFVNLAIDLWFCERKDMPLNLKLRSYILAVLLVALGSGLAFAQPRVELKPEKPPRERRIKGEKPNQLDIFKVDLFQIGVNEVRLWYEMQRGKRSSFEFGVGAIYKN